VGPTSETVEQQLFVEVKEHISLGVCGNMIITSSSCAPISVSGLWWGTKEIGQSLYNLDNNLKKLDKACTTWTITFKNWQANHVQTLLFS
jgi:hypothetical protein